MSSTILRVAISGRVQGVGYRAWVEYEAMLRDLEGWVRNRRDGSVEAVFAGPDDVVTDMVMSCQRGPASARVDRIAQEDAGPDVLRLRHPGEEFSVLPTI
jgi:acylphosphatase